MDDNEGDCRLKHHQEFRIAHISVVATKCDFKARELLEENDEDALTLQIPINRGRSARGERKKCKQGSK